MTLPDDKRTSLATVLEIAKIVPKYTGISDVNEFIEKLRICDDLTETFDNEVKEQCVKSKSS